MAIPPFDPSTVVEYGARGQEDIQSMANALQAHALPLTYNAGNGKFTIYNSAEIDIETIQRIVKIPTYQCWKPRVLDETDDLRNKQVKLVSVQRSVESIMATDRHWLKRWEQNQQQEQDLANNTLKAEISGLQPTDLRPSEDPDEMPPLEEID